MATANTGLKRSLTIDVVKEVNGVVVTGYPKYYYGQLQFIYNGITYPAISNPTFALMTEADYTARLNAFKLYVASLEPGINFATDVVAGFEPTKTDLADCPLDVEAPPQETTTTTTTTVDTTPRRTINVNMTFDAGSGLTDGMSGETVVCGVSFAMGSYVKVKAISTTSLAAYTCIVDMTGVIAKLAGVQLTTTYIYYRYTGDTDWINIMEDKYVVIPVNGTVTVNLEVLVTDRLVTLVCDQWLLTKTVDDATKGLFNTMSCSGMLLPLEVQYGNPVTMCLHDAIPVNPVDTAESLGDCPTEAGCYEISEQLGWGVSSSAACLAVKDVYYGNNSSFALTTTISASPVCLVTLAGYYSNGTIWKYTSDGINFTSEGTCGTVIEGTPVQITHVGTKDMLITGVEFNGIPVTLDSGSFPVSAGQSILAHTHQTGYVLYLINYTGSDYGQNLTITGGGGTGATPSCDDSMAYPMTGIINVVSIGGNGINVLASDGNCI